MCISSYSRVILCLFWFEFQLWQKKKCFRKNSTIFLFLRLSISFFARYHDYFATDVAFQWFYLFKLRKSLHSLLLLTEINEQTTHMGEPILKRITVCNCCAMWKTSQKQGNTFVHMNFFLVSYLVSLFGTFNKIRSLQPHFFFDSFRFCHNGHMFLSHSIRKIEWHVTESIDVLVCVHPIIISSMESFFCVQMSIITDFTIILFISKYSLWCEFCKFSLKIGNFSGKNSPILFEAIISQIKSACCKNCIEKCLLRKMCCFTVMRLLDM